MSEDWAVYLTFTDSKSNKFWRARVDGDTLYVNYGRIGSSGQTQVKELGSTDACEKELDKLAPAAREEVTLRREAAQYAAEALARR